MTKHQGRWGWAHASLFVGVLGLIGQPSLNAIVTVMMLNPKYEPRVGAISIWGTVLLSPLCGFAAVVFGHLARRKAREEADSNGRGLALAGLIMGYGVIVQSFVGQVVGRIARIVL